MSDKELDNLIMASLERQQTLDALNNVIISDVRRRARREWLRRWGRIVVFSFGLPLLLLVFAAGIYVTATLPSTDWPRIVLVIPIVAMLAMAGHKVRNFSITRV